MKRHKQHIATSLKRPASPSIVVDDDEVSDRTGESCLGQSNMLKPPFLPPSAIVRSDRSNSFINLTEAYRGNPYDIRNLSPHRRRSEPPNSQVMPALESSQYQAAGHPEFEMDYEEQPLDMSIKGKSIAHSSEGSSSSLSPSVECLPASPASKSTTCQVNRPSVITCAPSLKIKNGTNGPCLIDLSSDAETAPLPLTKRIVSTSLPDQSSLKCTLPPTSPASNGHSQDSIIANETAKLNISTSIALENPVDEHFRRSLGGLFSTGLFKASSSKTPSNKKPVNCSLDKTDSDSLSDQSGKSSVTPVTSIVTEISNDVDDHFAKALGADWLKKLRKSDTLDQTSVPTSRLD